jgi:hypothetical protein
MKTQQVNALADRLGKHPATIFRWLNLGLDIDSETSIQEFLQGKKRKRNPHTSAIAEVKTQAPVPVPEPDPDPDPDLDQIELGPVGKRGAAAALMRLEEIEERAHARLMRAIEAGNPFQVKAAQEFYLRSSETLRRLDLAVETERRNSEEQVPMRQVEDISLQIATWLRLSFERFLNAESPGLMGIKDLGEFKFSAIERFRGILHRTVKAAIGNNSPIPPWAESRVIEAWNVPQYESQFMAKGKGGTQDPHEGRRKV